MNRTDVGTPSSEYLVMESVRLLPRMLDSSRQDGGINLLLSSPGGRLFSPGQGDKKLRPLSGQHGDGSPRYDIVSLGAPQFTGERPLLIQHQAEGMQDYKFRAAIAAPRKGFWHSVDSLAGRPWEQPIKISDNAPENLRDGGEWILDADLRGNSLRTLGARMTQKSAGYGLSYWWVDFDRVKKRPFIRTLMPETVSRVHFEAPGQRRIHVRMTRAEYENPADAFNASKFPATKHLIMVFRDGDPRASTGDERWAWYEVYEATDGEGLEYSEHPSKVEIETGRFLDRVSLEPHTKIPFVPVPTGEMSESHFILPPMLEAAQLDYLLLQVTSNLEYATIIANTFIRFAKGLNAKDIEEWQTLAPQIFYATTSKDADMKWVTLGAEALNAGMELSQFLMRALEVAGLAPMLTRSPGDERATGQAIASSRVLSIAEAYYLQWQSATAKVLNLEAEYEIGSTTADKITVQLRTDLKLDGSAIDHGNMLSRLFLDPTQNFPALTFYSELKKIGIIGEDVDIDALVKASESPEFTLDKERLATEKAGMLVSMALSDHGHFQTKDSSEVLYGALQNLGVLPDDAKPDDLAEQFDLARQRSRNQELILNKKQQISTKNYWAAEEADSPVNVDLDLELDPDPDLDPDLDPETEPEAPPDDDEDDPSETPDDPAVPAPPPPSTLPSIG